MEKSYPSLIDSFLDACNILCDVYKKANDLLAKQSFEDLYEVNNICRLRQSVCAMLEKSNSF